MVSFFIPGDPVPQGRPRACLIGGRVVMYDPKTSKDWKKIVSQVASLYCKKPFSGALSLELTFWLRKAKSCKEADPIKRPDVDNLGKAVMDACNGILYKDDSQIISLSVYKRYACDDGGVLGKIEPGVDVTLTTGLDLKGIDV